MAKEISTKYIEINEEVKAIRGRRDPELAARAGGALWLPVFFEVDSLEWPD